MINVLLHTELDLVQVAKDKGVSIQISEVPEMNGLNYSLIVNSKAQLINIAQYIKANDPNASVIGCWKIDGSLVKFTNPTMHRHFGFKINKYLNRLKNRIARNGLGEITEERAYTIIEARLKKVNKFYGWADRQIQIDEVGVDD